VSDQKPEGTKKKGLSTQATVLIIALTLIIAGTAIAAILILGKKEPPVVVVQAETPRPRVVTEENYRELQEVRGERVAKGMFYTHFSNLWTFPDGKSASTDAVMGNSANNLYPFYFTLTLADTGELVYTSGVLPLGTEIDQLVLDTELPAGTYPAVIGIHMIDENGEERESDSGFNITLDIQS
jgi:hypothetical protein